MKFTGGLPETHCGAGSTLKTTETLRAALPGLLRDCKIRTLLDAPCGDGNWIAETDLSGVHYHGVDLSADNLQRAHDRIARPGFEPASQCFQLGDITRIDVAPSDAIMCRDFFQHLPTQTVLDLLRRIKISGIKWLLATSFDNEENTEIGPEMFRPLNIRAAPFDFGQSEYEIPDPPGSGRILGAWRL